MSYKYSRELHIEINNMKEDMEEKKLIDNDEVLENNSDDNKDTRLHAKNRDIIKQIKEYKVNLLKISNSLIYEKFENDQMFIEQYS